MDEWLVSRHPALGGWGGRGHTHCWKRVFQFMRTKSQARDCPTTLLAMLLMVDMASWRRIMLGSKVY